jgi:hypothetical protein
MIHAHNLLRWVVLILALWTIFKSFNGRSGKRAFTAADRKAPLFFMISMDIQLLIGLALYITGAWGVKNIQNQGMGNVMKDAYSRFYAVEHLVGMLLAVILAHMANSVTKRAIPDDKKFKKIFLFSLLSLLVMLATIPWPFRGAIGRPLFPGM